MLDYKELSINPYHLNRNISVANAPGPNDKVYGSIFDYGADYSQTWTTDKTPHPDSPEGQRRAEEEAERERARLEKENKEKIMNNSVLGDENLRIVPIEGEGGQIIDHRQAPMPEDSINVINAIPEIEEEKKGSNWDFDN